MESRPAVISGALLASLALYGGAALLSSNAWWGINHLKFLPPSFTLAYWGMAALALLLVVRNPAADRIGVWYIRLCTALYNRPLVSGSIIGIILVSLFMLFRLETYFLGDGYNILATFSTGEVYFLKWTEAGAILVLRFLQSLSDEYSRATALQSLVAVSVVSGFITVLNLIWIARRVSATIESFSFALPTLLFSGSVLLFFGYVEFYPLLWAAATTWINAATYFLVTHRRPWLVLLLFGVAASVHLQVLYWTPALAYLLYEHLVAKGVSKRTRFAFFVIVGLVAIAALGAAAWLYRTRLDIRLIFLPLFSGRASSPDYGIFTPKHLVDILNLLFLVFPGAAVLAAYLASGRKSVGDPLARLFLWMSLGAVVFLFAVDPVLGMGRDWDLMSLPLLAVMLFVLRRISLSQLVIRPAQTASYALVTLSATILFVSTTVRVDASETRYFSLLEHYGPKNRSGWVILASYYADQKRWESQEQINRALHRYFPDEVLLVRAWEEIDRHNYSGALKIAEKLYATDPTRSDYIQLYGNALARNKQYQRAIELYTDAIRVRPYFAQQRKELGLIYLETREYDKALAELGRVWRQDKTITAAAEGIALAYIRMQLYDSALAYAQQLYEHDPNSPGGNLIEMTIALNRGDLPTARSHYEQYLAHGSGRSDYENIKSYYGPYFQ